MDTIVNPRHLSETESEGSVKGTSNTKLASRQHHHHHHQRHPHSRGEATSREDQKDEKIIICPTARFLQVNQKKISSYDLLVRPPKRPRLFTALTSEEEELQEAEGQQKHPRSLNQKEEEEEEEEVMEGKEDKFPLEFIHFENETKLKDSTREIGIHLPVPKRAESEENNGNFWRRASSSVQAEGIVGTEKKKHEKQEDSNNNEELKATNDDVTMIYKVIDEASASAIPMKKNIWSATKSFPHQDRTRSPSLNKNKASSMSQKSKQFSKSRGSIGRNSREHTSFQTIYKVVNEKDENRNFLAMENNSDLRTTIQELEQEVPSHQVQRNPGSKDSIRVVGGRAIKVPFYRQPESYRSIGTVFLKESDYDASLELDPLKSCANLPCRKKIRLSIPEDFPPELEFPPPPTAFNGCSPGQNVTFLYQTCDEDLNKSETMSSEGEVPIQVQEGYSDHTDPAVHLPSSSQRLDDFDDVLVTPRETPLGCETELPINFPQECGAFIAGDFSPEEFASSFINLSFDGSGFMSDAQVFDPNLFGGVGVDGEINFPMPDGATPMPHDSPFAIFIQDIGPESGFMFDLDPNSFTERPLSVSRIEDVTDIEFNEEAAEVVVPETEPVKTVDGDFDTILKAKDPSPSEKDDSGSCQSLSINELLRGSKDSNRMNEKNSEDLNGEEQEFLIQPTTHLNYSTSLHSATETGGTEPNHTSTTDRLLVKSTKSDYFVGKISGLSKSVMKLYQKCVRTPSKDSHAPSKKSSSCRGFPTPETKVEGGKEEGETKKSEDPKPNKEPKHRSQTSVPPTTSTPKASQSQASLKNSLTTCYRKVSTGNRISNIKIPNSIQLNRGRGSGRIAKPPDEAGDTAVKGALKDKSSSVQPNNEPKVSDEGVLKDQASSSKRLSQKRPLKAKIDKQVVEIGKPKSTPQSTFLLKSSSSSSMALKPQYFRKPPGHDKKKEGVDGDGVEGGSLVKRFTRLFTRAKKTKNRVTSAVPSKNSKSIAQHTDSVELYRERRYKFFEEQKEFQDDSLKVYYKMLLNNSSKQNSLFGSRETVNPPGKGLTRGGSPQTTLNLPLTSAIPAMKYLQARESVESDVIIPARAATSESALPTSENRSLRQNLVLQCPPIMHMLALSAQGQSDTGQGQGSLLMQEKFKRPRKGILKKRNETNK